MLLLFLVKFVGHVLIDSLDWFLVVLFVISCFLPCVLLVSVNLLKLILAVRQIVLCEVSDSILILDCLLFYFFSWSLVAVVQSCASPLDAIFAIRLPHVVELVLQLPIVFHHILVICLVIKVILASCCKLVSEVTVMMRLHNLLAEALLFHVEFLESIVHHLFL